MRLAQTFSMRYPLVDGQGNFGSVDGDAPAAERYTEARLTEFAEEMLRDMEKDTVNMRPNYDESREEPVVLPSAVPNLLVNGSSGIAVGMATNVPPHNLREIVDAIHHVIDQPDCPIEDLLRIVQGPGLPDRRRDLRPPGNRRLLHDRPRSHHRPLARDGRGDQEGPPGDHRDRDSLHDQQGGAPREDRRPGQGRDARGDLGPPRRVGPRGNAGRHRAEARCPAQGDLEPALQAHADADHLRLEHARAGRQPADDADARRR